MQSFLKSCAKPISCALLSALKSRIQDKDMPYFFVGCWEAVAPHSIDENGCCQEFQVER
jgi:hypothetical protein